MLFKNHSIEVSHNIYKKPLVLEPYPHNNPPIRNVNPNLDFAQGIPGKFDGRSSGIIEFSGIRNVISAIELLEFPVQVRIYVVFLTSITFTVDGIFKTLSV